MTVLVAFVREAQPGRVAEVRRALQDQAATMTRQYEGIRTYQVMQGRAQTNLYVDLVEWESRSAFEIARESLREAAEDVRHLFLRPARVRVYRPLTIVRAQRREAQAAGVGLVRVRPGTEEQYATHMEGWLNGHYRHRPGLVAVGVYQSEDEAQQFLVRNTWETEEALIAHRTWMTREMLPTTDPWVARRELLALLMRWHYRQPALAQPEPV
jgi:quinol monooxygenase YgiN